MLREYDPIPATDPARRPVPAWLFSVVLHAGLLLVAGLLMARAPSGTGAEADRPVGMALVRTVEDRVDYEPVRPQPDSTDENPAENPSENAVASAATAAPAVDLDELLQATTRVDVPAAGGPTVDAIRSAAAASTGTGPDLSDGRPSVRTELFGIEAYGNRFVYVFDRSDSMNGFGGRPLAAAKMELVRSLGSLGPKQQFQIIFYNTQSNPFVSGSGMVELLPGDERTKRMASQYVRALQAYGGTEHLDAIKMALRMSPDVVFFLTDARLPKMGAASLAELRARALRSNTTIHTIEFGSEPAPPPDTFLRALAEQNQGVYRYVNIRQLGENGSVAGMWDDDVK